MKTQMKVQKYLCLVMLILGAISLLYAFMYMSGPIYSLGRAINNSSEIHFSWFQAADGKYDAMLYEEMQSFNTLLMYFGIVMILLAVLLYITSCQKRRNYYISNYVAIGACAGGDFVLSLVCLIMNAIWRGKFLNVDFDAWALFLEMNPSENTEKISADNSTLWFDLGFVVYILIIIASVLLILNLVWKIMLMKGEKKLLANENALVGGETV